MTNEQKSIEALLDEACTEVTRAWSIMRRVGPLKYEEVINANKCRVSAQAALAEAAVIMDRMRLGMIADRPEHLMGAIDKMLDSGDLKNPPMERLIAETLRTGRVPMRIPPVEELDCEDESVANEQAAQVDRTLQATIRRMGGGR